jgi:hypothetical protein
MINCGLSECPILVLGGSHTCVADQLTWVEVQATVHSHTDVYQVLTLKQDFKVAGSNCFLKREA